MYYIEHGAHWFQGNEDSCVSVSYSDSRTASKNRAASGYTSSVSSPQTVTVSLIHNYLFKTFQILSNSNELKVTRQNATVDKIRRVAKHEIAQQAVLAITWTLGQNQITKECGR